MTEAKSPKAEAPAYFEGCFPTRAVIFFDREQAMLWSPAIKEHKRGRANHCVVEVTHVPPQRKARVNSRLGRMMKTDGESWNAVDFNFVLMKDMKGEIPMRLLGWDIRDVDFNAGF